MLAIVLPLNEFFYNFKKYDGISREDRFDRNHPALVRFFKTKTGEWVLKYLLAFPVFIFILVLFYLPIYTFFLIRCGHKKAKANMEVILLKYADKASAVMGKKRKDVHAMLSRCLIDNPVIFVYYTPEMIPKKRKNQKVFFKKLALMKKEFDIFHLQLVNKKDDNETMIWLFDIDRVEYFLMTMQLEISSPELLIPLGSTQEIFDEKKIVRKRMENVIKHF